MTDALPSRLALVLDVPVDDLDPVLEAARLAGHVDRVGPLGAEPRGPGPVLAREVHWGGRTQRAAVRALTDDADGAPLVRVEAVVAADGWSGGIARQASLVRGIAEALPGRVRSLRDGSARRDRPLAWLDRAVAGDLTPEDVVEVVVAGADADGGTAAGAGAAVVWVHTHGAARFGVPDLELYGLAPTQVEDGVALVRSVLARLLVAGLGAPLEDRGRALRLVPVLQVWPHLPLGWPGVGRGGRDRGPGLDGPRATLSVLHRPRLGRHRLDVDGVVAALGPSDGTRGRRRRGPAPRR